MVVSVQSYSLDITDCLIRGCCRALTTAVLFYPGSQQTIPVVFQSVSGNRIEFSNDGQADLSRFERNSGQTCCVHFRFDNATRLLLCRCTAITDRITVEVLSDCVARDRRADFRVPLREQTGFSCRVTHKRTGTATVQVRDVSNTGLSAMIPRSMTEFWLVGDIINVEMKLDSTYCSLSARVSRLCNTVALELLDPGTHQSPMSPGLKCIVAELQRRYLRNRIRV